MSLKHPTDPAEACQRYDYDHLSETENPLGPWSGFRLTGFCPLVAYELHMVYSSPIILKLTSGADLLWDSALFYWHCTQVELSVFHSSTFSLSRVHFLLIQLNAASDLWRDSGYPLRLLIRITSTSWIWHISMRGETVNGAWVSALWPLSRKSVSDEKEVIGILAFEVAGLMSKVVNLWHSLSGREVMNLKEWIMNSVGVKMLMSDDHSFLIELALDEILNNFESLARSVARLSKRCKDPVYHGYEHFVHNPSQNYPQWSGWEYAWKKMERKVKKMERFVAAMSLLSPELDVLADKEQTLRRMKDNPACKSVKLLKFQKKVMWQRQQVKTLKDMSPWNRSYDYVVRLLARSLSTILERIILVFGSSHLPIEKPQNDSISLPMNKTNNHLTHCRSFSAPMHSCVRPSKTNPKPIGSMPVLVNKNKNKIKKKEQQVLPSESKQFNQIGPFKGCMSIGNGNDSPVVESFMPINAGFMRIDNMKTVDKLSLFHRSRIYLKLSIKGRLRPASSTLGYAALALHYANVIVLIEKIVSVPHLIDFETRDNLYNMLPTTIRTALRGKLKWYAKSKPCKIHEARLAVEWSKVLTQILEWLAPLAHNMRRWHSERNFEKEHTASKANVLLIQTLYFANQAKTEAAIVELLVGLHYVCKIDREACMRDAPEFAGSKSFNGVRLRKNELYCKHLER
ncbi:hypothetical protein VNO77_16033 [Canavalia gladiata]|uniref:DUF668 domain-containing protein n=1 Tax=Canavalia gladiata TaxID=3824 RepID=A0AAN9M3F8_CANGL